MKKIRVKVRRSEEPSQASTGDVAEGLDVDWAMSTGKTEGAPGRAEKRPEKRPGPVGGKRDENRRLRAAELQDAALGLMLERGLLVVTVDDITSRAGVAKGSFYRYFDSKEHLIERLFAPLHDRLDVVLAAAEVEVGGALHEPELLAAYRQLAARLQDAFIAHPREVLLYLQEARGPAQGDRRPVGLLEHRVSRAAIDLTRRAHEHGLLRAVDPLVSALAVVGAAERLLYEFLTRGTGAAPADVAQALVTLIMDGLWKSK
ncbi:MAG: TetR/AcrR family transcriptional regulator [Myxococcales bacterium]|nr:TetR/AcrR family transcriptional regulator [Myxococcales bacterium]